MNGEAEGSGKGGAARCLVFGGSGTLGGAVCRTLAEQGARVAFTWHANEEAAGRLVAEVPAAHALRADLGTAAGAEAAVDAAVAALGGLDAFVQCAGVGFPSGAAGAGSRARIADIDEAAWDRTFAINVKSTFFAVRRLADVLRRDGGGNIVLVGSIDGVKPMPSPASYASSKGALGGLALSLAKELGPSAIRVNVVAPGLLDGGMSRTLPDDLRAEYLKHCGLKRLGGPAEVANVIAWLALHNTYVTGQTMLVDGAL